MSVIMESQAGDELICICEFSGPPDGVPRTEENQKTFHFGERVRYVTFRQNQHYKDLPGLGWDVLFDAADGKRYAATQTLFVTEETWQRLKKYFAKRVLREPRRKQTPKQTTPTQPVATP